jgi:Fur family ferric uptake transcriptional regulator
MATEQESRQILRKSGFKATSARIAILGTLKKAKKPMSAQAIFEVLAGDLDRATVYRSVKSLKEKGIIVPIDLRHNHVHYELANLAEHHHLICIQCGKVEDVHHCGLEEMQTKVLRSSKHFAKITEHALEFYGLCKKCDRHMGAG